MAVEEAKLTQTTPVTGSAPTGGDQRPPGQRRVIPRRALIFVALAAVLVIALIAAGIAVASRIASIGSQATPTTTTTVPPTIAPTVAPTATVVPTTLYHADWSRGAGGWALPAGWSAGDGKLITDVNTGAQVAVPYVVTASSYTVEADVQILTAHPTGSSNQRGSFELVGTDNAGRSLFDLRIECYQTQQRAPSECVGETGIMLGQPASPDNRGFFNDSYYAHEETFAVQVQGTALTRCARGCDWNGASAVALAPAHLALAAHNIQIQVTRLVVTTP